MSVEEVLIRQIKAALGLMTPDERLEFIEELHKDYCRWCGVALNPKGGFCNCSNDA